MDLPLLALSGPLSHIRILMDILTLLSNSLWPIVALVALWVVNEPLKNMISRINPTKLDAWGLKAEFKDRLDKVEMLSLEQTSVELDTILIEHKNDDIIILEKSPETKILRAWNRLAKSLLRDKFGVRRTEANINWTTDNWIKHLAEDLALTADELAALKELQILRNRVAHSTLISITVHEAERFESVADNLRQQIFNRLSQSA